jgi:two-component system, OmpR family, phosphate regulon sensor histidine kinase PhoR
MTWPIRWKVTVGTLVAVACGLLIAGVMAVQSLERQYLTRLGEVLEAKTKLIEYGFQPLFQSPSRHPPSHDLQALARDLGNRASARVTVVAADGTVLADSAIQDADLPTVENHKSRPEIQQAFSADMDRTFAQATPPASERCIALSC